MPARFVRRASIAAASCCGDTRCDADTAATAPAARTGQATAPTAPLKSRSAAVAALSPDAAA